MSYCVYILRCSDGSYYVGQPDDVEKRLVEHERGMLSVYTRTHRKDGRPYIAEAAHPETGSWDGHDTFYHSEHYFHSHYIDLIVTGLVGLRPRADDTLEVAPLAPEVTSFGCATVYDLG